jgi:hypothetical protein
MSSDIAVYTVYFGIVSHQGYCMRISVCLHLSFSFGCLSGNSYNVLTSFTVGASSFHV